MVSESPLHGGSNKPWESDAEHVCENRRERTHRLEDHGSSQASTFKSVDLGELEPPVTTDSGNWMD